MKALSLCVFKGFYCVCVSVLVAKFILYFSIFVHALVCTVDYGLGADDGLVDEVVSEDGVHCNFLSALLALAIGRNPYFI